MRDVPELEKEKRAWGRTKKKNSITFFAWTPVHHRELRVVLVRLAPPRRLLVQGADRVVSRSVAAANQLRLSARANVLALKLSARFTQTGSGSNRTGSGLDFCSFETPLVVVNKVQPSSGMSNFPFGPFNPC